jgi:hypothetical protein
MKRKNRRREEKRAGRGEAAITASETGRSF